VQPPGNEDAEENGEEALIFYGQEQRRDLGLVAHLGDGDEAEGNKEMVMNDKKPPKGKNISRRVAECAEKISKYIPR
jgi:hypothetical protein